MNVQVSILFSLICVSLFVFFCVKSTQVQKARFSLLALVFSSRFIFLLLDFILTEFIFFANDTIRKRSLAIRYSGFDQSTKKVLAHNYDLKLSGNRKKFDIYLELPT